MTAMPKRGRGRPALEGGTEALYVRIPSPLRRDVAAAREARPGPDGKALPEAEATREALELWVRREQRRQRRGEG